MKVIKIFMMFLIIVGLFTACGGGSSGSSPNVVLFLDSIVIEQDIDPNSGIADDDELEIHLMDANSETLIACLGEDEKEVMSYMRTDLFYANMDAKFRIVNDADVSDDTPVILRLVQKSNRKDNCPSGYDSSEEDSNGNPETPDKLITELSLNYGDLFSGEIDLNGFATVSFNGDTDVSTLIAVEEDIDGGNLSLNQLYLSGESFNDDELSRPEVSLFLANFSTFEMVACIDLEVIEAGGVLYADLDYQFVDENGQNIILDDLDGEYWIILAELDGARCPDPVSLSGPSKDILANTGLLTADDLLETINFENNYGSVELFLK